MAVHSEFGASSAYRWMACPGSVSMSRGVPNTSSVYAEEGTAAHEMGELAIKAGKPASAYVGAKASNGVEYTEEMAGRASSTRTTTPPSLRSGKRRRASP